MAQHTGCEVVESLPLVWIESCYLFKPYHHTFLDSIFIYIHIHVINEFFRDLIEGICQSVVGQEVDPMLILNNDGVKLLSRHFFV